MKITLDHSIKIYNNIFIYILIVILSGKLTSSSCDCNKTGDSIFSIL